MFMEKIFWSDVKNITNKWSQYYIGTQLFIDLYLETDNETQTKEMIKVSYCKLSISMYQYVGGTNINRICLCLYGILEIVVSIRISSMDSWC